MQGYLVEALKERMAYLRKPDGLKRGKEAASGTKAEAKPVRLQMPALIPSAVLLPLGEDKASHSRHLKLLQQECKNIHPNKQVRPCKHACILMWQHACPVLFPYFDIEFLFMHYHAGNEGPNEADLSN